MRRHTGAAADPPSPLPRVEQLLLMRHKITIVSLLAAQALHQPTVEHLLTDVLIAKRVSRTQLTAVSAAATFARDFMPPLTFR